MSQQINTINATCQNVPNRNVSRRARRSEETRARIFKAALELFAERGFNAATIEAITEAADVGKGTFFNYFENKESLLLEFREMQMGRVKTFVADNMKSKASLNKLIYDLAVTMTEEQRKSPVLFQSLITAVFTNETIKQRMSEGLSRSRQMLGDLIACRQQRGEIRS
ncbi:MAG: helix-turn-helix domain-containing protein, partial [Oryzomonas sp.]